MSIFGQRFNKRCSRGKQYARDKINVLPNNENTLPKQRGHNQYTRYRYIGNAKQNPSRRCLLDGPTSEDNKCETVKYGLKSQGTRTRERLRCQGPAAYTKDRPDLSSERAPHMNKTATVIQVIQIWS
jgi:hypothetical protein